VTAPSSGSRTTEGSDRISIAGETLEALVEHARRDAPRECCGLLIGAGGRIDEAVAVANLAPGATRYLLDPAGHFAALKRVRGTPRDVLGAYHSHPHSAPVPSPTDIAEALQGAFLYMIVSLAVPLRPDIRAYRIVDGTSVEIAIDVR
jgi:proteasome lid subunit RPN8/RPN11